MRAPLTKILTNILIALVSITVVLAIAEITFRMFRPQDYLAATVNTWDRETGTRQIPNAKGFVTCGEYHMDLLINSKGLRDREFPYEKPRGTTRILILGDSFACGYGVQAEETLAKVLEQLLNGDEDERTNWEVLNAGIGSTGTAHQLAFFKTEGYKYQPDYVVLCFCQSNDFWDNITSGLYKLRDGNLVKQDAPLTGSRKIQRYVGWIPGYNTIFARSHLLNFIKFRVSRYHYRDLAGRIQLASTQPSVEQAEEELTQALILSLRDACVDVGCELVLTVVPSHIKCSFDNETARLVESMVASGIRFVDFRPAFRRAIQEGTEVTYTCDGHWTDDGHRLAAQVLHSFFLGAHATAEPQQ